MPERLDYSSLPKRRRTGFYAALAAGLGLVGIVGLAVTLTFLPFENLLPVTITVAALSLGAVIGAILAGSRV